MNVLLYLPDITQEWGGVRQYTVALLRILGRDTQNRYWIYHNYNDAEVQQVVALHQHFTLVQDSDVEESAVRQRVHSIKSFSCRVANWFGMRLQHHRPSTIERICAANNITLIHCPYQYIPQIKGVRLIVTLHDVQELHFPQFFTPEIRAYRAVHYLDYITRADKVVVSYEHVRNDLIKYFSLPPEKIEVVLLNMDCLWFAPYLLQPKPPKPALRTPDYLFYPANVWEHKNHLNLLRAVAALRDSYGLVVNLICTGSLTDYYHTVIHPLLVRLALQEQVQFVGIVEEEQLFALYQHTRGVVVPTLYEAGSFPLMESLLLGIPVICSNVTSLPDTVGDARFIFDPTDIGSIAEKMQELWTSPAFRQASLANGVRAAHRLQHTGALSRFLQLYQELHT